MISSISESVLAVSSDPVLCSEADRLLPKLKADAAPASGRQMVAVMFPYQEIFHRVVRDVNQWKSYWQIYVDALDGMSEAALAMALKDYVKRGDSEFFPKPGPLLSMCQAHQEAINRRWRIAQAALALPSGASDAMAVNAYSATFNEDLS